MKVFVVLSALAAIAFARPGGVAGCHNVGPVAYGAHVTYANLGSGAPVGYDGRVVDTPEVAIAKLQNAAAHVNEKITLANEAAKHYAAYSGVSAYSAPALSHIVSTYDTPAGFYGRAADTPDVAIAKLHHTAAHYNEKITQAHEAANHYGNSPVVASAYSTSVTSGHSAHPYIH